MSANQRQKEIIEYLCERRQDTMSNLAFEFGVSRQTIVKDINELSLSYPIYTVCGKHGGGVYVAEGFYLYRGKLTDKQYDLLERLSKELLGEDAETMKAILSKFPKVKRSKA